MKVIKSLNTSIKYGSRRSVYYYRVVRGITHGVQAYGIEVERVDYEGEDIVSIERDAVETISPHPHKVYELLNLLYSNIVSPIHLIDVIGEFVDDYIQDFDRGFCEIATN